MVLIPIPSTVMLNSNPVDVAGLPSLDEESGTESRQLEVLSNDAAPVLDAFLQSCDAERFGIWSFRTLVRGIEWDPALFTRVRMCVKTWKYV